MHGPYLKRSQPGVYNLYDLRAACRSDGRSVAAATNRSCCACFNSSRLRCGCGLYKAPEVQRFTESSRSVIVASKQSGPFQPCNLTLGEVAAIGSLWLSGPGLLFTCSEVGMSLLTDSHY